MFRTRVHRYIHRGCVRHARLVLPRVAVDERGVPRKVRVRDRWKPVVTVLETAMSDGLDASLVTALNGGNVADEGVGEISVLTMQVPAFDLLAVVHLARKLLALIVADIWAVVAFIVRSWM